MEARAFRPPTGNSGTGVSPVTSRTRKEAVFPLIQNKSRTMRSNPYSRFIRWLKPVAIPAGGTRFPRTHQTMFSEKISSGASTETASKTHRQTAAIIAGDSDAFAVMYEEQFEYTYREAQRATRNADEATCLDLVHDAMMRFIQSLRVPIESDTALRAYLRRVVYSCAIDRMRAEQRRKQRENASTEQTVEHTDPTTDERLHWLRSQLDSLDDTQSTLLVMRYRFNWTLERIGRALGLSTLQWTDESHEQSHDYERWQGRSSTNEHE